MWRYLWFLLIIFASIITVFSITITVTIFDNSPAILVRDDYGRVLLFITHFNSKFG